MRADGRPSAETVDSVMPVASKMPGVRFARSSSWMNFAIGSIWGRPSSMAMLTRPCGETARAAGAPVRPARAGGHHPLDRRDLGRAAPARLRPPRRPPPDLAEPASRTVGRGLARVHLPLRARRPPRHVGPDLHGLLALAPLHHGHFAGGAMGVAPLRPLLLHRRAGNGGDRFPFRA